MMKKTVALLIFIIALLSPIAAKTTVMSIKLVAVVEEKTTFSFTSNGYCECGTNSSTQNFTLEVFDAFGNEADILDGRILGAGNYSVFINGR